MPEKTVDPIIGRLVAGRYRVLKPLGEGGMGQVYLAEHEAIEKKVALKVLRPEYSRKEDIVTRFQQEAISASRIKHPNVLDVFDFGRLDTGEAFLAMEFLEGHDLSDDLAKRGSIDPVRGLSIALQICRALAAAHSRGVVHRDMKPDNVFLQRTADGDEIVKIVDFGIAQLRTTEEAAKAEPTRRRLTKTGMIFGTPEYMAPEQAAGKKADHRVDIYAVGIILYEMFTGTVPFTGDSFMAVLASTLNESPPPMRAANPDLRVGPEIEAVIMRALAKAPEARFATMGDFANALIATPEGAPFVRFAAGAPGDPRLSSYPPAGIPTAAQFGSSSVPPPRPSDNATALSPTGTAQIGTPRAAATPKTPGGQSSTVTRSGKGNLGIVVSTVVGLAALVGGGFFALGHKPPRAEPPPAVAIAPELHTAPVITPVSAAAPVPTTPVAAATVVPVAAPATEVHVHVVTEPAGATLAKGGFQVCDATPCDLVVARNEALDLEAKKGVLRGQAKVMPQNDQDVTIKLVAPVARPPVERLCEVEIDGLKIARPCKK